MTITMLSSIFHVDVHMLAISNVSLISDTLKGFVLDTRTTYIEPTNIAKVLFFSCLVDIVYLLLVTRIMQGELGTDSKSFLPSVSLLGQNASACWAIVGLTVVSL